jgi:hypothetical protein
MPDPHTQAPKIRATQDCLDISQAIMPSVTATLFNLNLARKKIQLIVQHQNFLWHELVKACQRTHTLTRAIHERLRFDHPDLLTIETRLGHGAKESLFDGKGTSQIVGNGLGKPKACVVPRARVIGARVAKSHDEFDRLCHSSIMKTKAPSAQNG